MALEGLAVTHLGTRFWATSSVDKLKTLVTDEKGKVDFSKSTRLKSIWAGSSRIGSLAEKGVTSRFRHTFAAAKAFPKKLSLQELSNVRFLVDMLGGNSLNVKGDGKEMAQNCKQFKDYAERMSKIFSAKFPDLVDKLPMTDGQKLTDFVGQVVLAVNESVDFKAAAGSLEEGEKKGASSDYKTSLANATLGALRMIAEKGLSVDAVYTLGQKKVYDLSRYYDAYEVAWNALKDAGLIPDPEDDARVGVPSFDVGDGSKGALQRRLKNLAAYLKKRIDGNWNILGLENYTLVKQTLSLINYSLHMNGRERRLNEFEAEAHEALDRLEAASGGRKVSFGVSVGASVGADLGPVAKLKVEGKGKYDRGYSLSYGVGGLSVSKTDTLGGSIGATVGLGDVPGTKMPRSDIPAKGKGLVGGGVSGAANADVTFSSTNVYSETDDYIAASNGHSELVESTRKLGFLSSLKRLVRNIIYAISDKLTRYYEFSQRAFLETLTSGLDGETPLMKRLDGFFARQRVVLTVSRRDARSINGGLQGSVSFHAGLSKGPGLDPEQSELAENRLFDVSVSAGISGSSEGKVVATDHQSVSARFRSLPGSVDDLRMQVKERLQPEASTLKFDKDFEALLSGNGTDGILDYVEGNLRAMMQKAETDLAVDVEAVRSDFHRKDLLQEALEAAWTRFTKAWDEVAVRFEMLRRRMDELLSENGGQPAGVFSQFGDVTRYMVGRLDRPEIPNLPELEKEVDGYFNAEVANSRNQNRVRTSRVEFSFSAGLGSGVGGIAGGGSVDKIFGEAQQGDDKIFGNPGRVITEEVISNGVNQGVQALSDIAPIPTNVGVSVAIETQYPEIYDPAVPWENNETQTVTASFPTNALTRLIVDGIAEKIVASRVKGARRGSTPDMDKAAEREAVESVKKDLYNAIGMTAESLGNKTVSDLLDAKDLSANPKLHNFYECLRNGSITFKYEGERLTSVTNSTTSSATSGIGVDFKLGVFDVNVSVSKSFSETMPTRFLVNEMPIDAVLNRVNLLNPKTRRQSLLNYLAKNPTAAKKLAQEICGENPDKTVAKREKQAEKVLGILYKRFKDEATAGKTDRTGVVRSLWLDFQKAKSDLAERLVPGENPSDRVKLHSALANYLETLRDIFFYCSTQKVTYATTGNADKSFIQEARLQAEGLKGLSSNVRSVGGRLVCKQTNGGNTCFGICLVNALMSTDSGRRHLKSQNAKLKELAAEAKEMPKECPPAAQEQYDQLQPLERLFVKKSLEQDNYKSDMGDVDVVGKPFPLGEANVVCGLLGLKAHNSEDYQSNQISGGILPDQKLGEKLQNLIDDKKFVVAFADRHYQAVVGYDEKTNELILVDSQKGGKVHRVNVSEYNKKEQDEMKVTRFQVFEIDPSAEEAEKRIPAPSN